MKEVTAAIILKDNAILIAQRAPGENLSGKWEYDYAPADRPLVEKLKAIMV